jgi:ribonucleotide monophosphatase NagD (HAD superfamily)
VAFVGKPFPEIYATALRELSHALGRNIHSREVLAVGDSLATDVAGAAGAGLDSLLLASGVHVRDLCRGSMIDRVGLARLLSGAFRPHWVQRQLSW